MRNECFILTITDSKQIKTLATSADGAKKEIRNFAGSLGIKNKDIVIQQLNYAIHDLSKYIDSTGGTTTAQRPKGSIFGDCEVKTDKSGSCKIGLKTEF